MFEKYVDNELRRQSAEWWLQLIAFGAMLADTPRNGKDSKSIRDRVEIGDFSDADLRVACETLKGKNRDAQAAAIQRILRECGVDWAPTDGPPLDAILKRLRLDGEFQIAIEWMNMAHHYTNGYWDYGAKQQFLERLKGARDELCETREKGSRVLGSEHKDRQKVQPK